MGTIFHFQEMLMPTRISLMAVALLATGAGATQAGELNIQMLLAGEVAPGVYGQVQIGNAPPPPVVYAQPMIIEPQARELPPVYLHVPPGHAKDWRKHCREYHACDRQVYFVRSSEYDRDDRGRDRGRDHERDRDREHDRDQDRDREHDRGRDHDREGRDRD